MLVSTPNACDNAHKRPIVSEKQSNPSPERGPIADAVNSDAASDGSHNGNGKLPPLWEGQIHFVMRSFETTMALPAEEPVDVAATVLRKRPKAPN